MLNLKLQIILICVSLAFMAYIIHYLRNEIVDLKYSIVWFLLGTVLILISILPQLPALIARFLGIGLVINAVFLSAIFIILMMLLIFTIGISKMHNKLIRLTQEIALLRNELEELKK